MSLTKRTLLSPSTKANWFGQPGARLWARVERDAVRGVLLFYTSSGTELTGERPRRHRWLGCSCSGCCHRGSDRCPWKPVVIKMSTQQTIAMSWVFIQKSQPLLECFLSPPFQIWGFFFSTWVSPEVTMLHSPSCCSWATCALGFVGGLLLLTQLHRLFIGLFTYL